MAFAVIRDSTATDGFVDGLMVKVCKETIQKPGACIAWISRLVRPGVMQVMGDDIDLLRNYMNGQVARDKSPEPIEIPEQENKQAGNKGQELKPT